MYFRYEPDGTWTVLCEEADDVIERGYYSLVDAIEEQANVSCFNCGERAWEARSGIPEDYAEC